MYKHAPAPDHPIERRSHVRPAGMSSVLGARLAAGVTLIEVLVVTTVIALMASLALPVSQILRQREKENRLREILSNVRSAIDTGHELPGYKNFVSREIIRLEATSASESSALAWASSSGLLYPVSPSYLVGRIPQVQISDSGLLTPPSTLTVPINRRFLRRVPPHPFADWFPAAHWEFKAVATDVAAGVGPWYSSSTTDPWNTGHATGVIDIRSVGAGIGLDGTLTDNW